MNRRRVLLMASSLRGGGSERQTLLVAKYLDRAQFEPHLYVTQRDGELIDLVPEDVCLHAYSDQLPRRGVYFPGRALRQQARHVGEVLRRESIDVVYDRTFHMTLIAAHPCRQLNIPRLATIVSPPEQALPLVESRFLTLKRRRLAHAYGEARGVVAVSAAVAESACRYYSLPRAQLQVIHNGVDLSSLPPAATRLTRASHDRTTLVCVGRMTEEKGHADLIEAIAASESDWPPSRPPLQLRFIGDGPLREPLQAKAARKCRYHQVEFMGQLANPAPLIAAADALVLPSRFEGLPNVVLEAMALGTPVIATRSGGTVELQRDEPTVWWAEPGSPDSLRRAILAFATGRDEATRRAVAAQKLVQQHHDIRQTVRRIETLLQPDS